MSSITQDRPEGPTEKESRIPQLTTKGSSKKKTPRKTFNAELTKVCLNQISILVTTLTSENFESHYKQIRFILTQHKHNDVLLASYYEKLLGYVSFSKFEPGRAEEQLTELNPVECLLKKELDLIAKDLNNLELFFGPLAKFFIDTIDEDPYFNSIVFVSKFNCDTLLSLILLIKFHPHSYIVKGFIQLNSHFILDHIRNRKFPKDYNWDTLLDFILNTPFFPFVQKLLTLSSLKAFEANIEPINRFFRNILKMSFKELLMEVGPENLLPEKLLPSLLQIKPNEIDQSIALILSEILIPTSQGLSNGLTAAANLPEANAKGAQLQACFRFIEQQSKFTVNWYLVFSHVHDNLFESAQRNIQPTVGSITQFFSSLDFKPGVIDIFLNYEWWFSKTLLYILQTIDPSQGGYDISSSKNLTLCFEDEAKEETPAAVAPPPGQPQPRRNILKFVNVGKLELHVLTKIQQQQHLQKQLSEQDQKLNSYLNQVFEHDYRVFPEYLIFAALTVPEKTQFIADLIDTLFALLIENDSAAMPKVLKSFKELDVQTAIAKLIDYCAKRQTPECISKVLYYASTVGLIPELLAGLLNVNIKFYVSFLIESSLHGFDYKPIVDAKLKDTQHRAAFTHALVDCLSERAQKDFEKGQEGIPGLTSGHYRILKIPDVYYFLEKIKANKGVVDLNKLQSLQLLLLTTYPRLINFGNGHDNAILSNAEISNFFPPNVESEMKAYYSKMYNKEVEIKDIVDMLISMKSSDEPHKQDVFACMIHSLLDEYRFFSEYPLSALASTSLLFGALLEKDLIQGTTLTVALNFIWESCNQPQDSPLFKFAVQSLYNFKSRLHEYPMYCKHLLECRSLPSHAKMYQIVKDAANGIPCSAPVVSSTPEASGPKYQSITVTDKTIGYVAQEEPKEAIADKILFNVNNLTEANIKSNDIQELLAENYFLWFANYLVVDRAKAEPNNHILYASLVNSFENAILFEYVLNVSLKEVERLIRNYKDSSTEKNQIKNLGAWLGKITLANDRALRRDQIALKFLLVEAFDFKTLPVIIPFVCKILDQAKYSKIFKPPNPWVLGVIKVLNELYECADLSLTLKFEVEVLLGAFGLTVKDVEPLTLVRSHNPNPVALAAMFGIHPETVNLANDLAGMALEASEQMDAHSRPAPPSMMPEVPGVADNREILHPQILQHQQPQQPQQEQTLDTSFSTLNGNSIFTQNANLRRAFQASLARSVRECAIPILTRVSEAVLVTTEALIKKDFATEGDPVKFRKNYQNMAVQLSRVMVSSSGRKLLSETIEATMLQILSGNPVDVPLAELNGAVQANVQLCVDIVDRIAADNISELIDEKMQVYVRAREQHKAGEQYIEPGASEYSLNLPEPLGLSVNGLSAQQLRIYETFGAHAPLATKVDPQQVPQPQVPIQEKVNTQVVVPEEEITFEQLFTAFTQHCEKAIELLSEVSETKLTNLDLTHPITAVLSQALVIAQMNALKFPELLLKAAQYAVNCLFTQVNENPMSNEIYVVILDKLCEFSPSTAKDVTWWLVQSSDQRKFNVSVIYSLLKVQLVLPIKLDDSLSKLVLESQNPVVVKFASSLLAAVYSAEEVRPIALRSEFGLTLDALAKYTTDGTTEEHKLALEARDKLMALLKDNKLKGDQLYYQLGYVFAEWFKLVTHGENTEQLQEQFIAQLFETKILVNTEYFGKFFKAAIEIAVTSFSTEHELRTRTQHETYLAVDTLAMLIVKIVLNFEDKKDGIEYLKKIMSIVILELTNDHEAAKQWNERAYFRFFSSLLASWSDALVYDANATASVDIGFYQLIGDTLICLQPLVFPGFTFAWVSLVGHRLLLPNLLELPDNQGYVTVVRLLTALLKFQCVYSKNALNDVVNVIFRAINRLFIGLHRDYPEFLVQCHYQLTCAIPRNYVQLRNIVLSATPRDVKVIDPFTQGLKVNRLPEVNEAPLVAYKPVDDLIKVGLKKPLENFLRIPAPALMRSIYAGMKLNHPKEVYDFGVDVLHFNVKLINALVLHVGMSAIADSLNSASGFNTKSSQVSLLVDLMNHGSLEFRYHLINAITNQLRYPNSHTHWFVSVVLLFFTKNNIWTGGANMQLEIQELITRVLLERIIANKPHPWGLSIVFIELIKNDDLKFFQIPFVKNADAKFKVIFDALAQNVKGSSE